MVLLTNTFRSHYYIWHEATGQLDTILQNEDTAAIALEAIKEHPFPGVYEMDPIVIVAWNAAGFNDNAALPNCRNGVAGQTQAALIAHIVANGGANIKGYNVAFAFVSGDAFQTWTRNVPQW
jgi:hypothetical protein